MQQAMASRRRSHRQDSPAADRTDDRKGNFAGNIAGNPESSTNHRARRRIAPPHEDCRRIAGMRCRSWYCHALAGWRPSCHRRTAGSGGGSCRHARDHRRRPLKLPEPFSFRWNRNGALNFCCDVFFLPIGLSASPLRPLTRRPIASWRACLSGSGCPFPCR